MAVNWDLARVPNVLDGFNTGFQNGREMGRQRAVQGALSRYATDPEGGARDLMAAGEIQSALTLQEASERKKTRDTRAKLLQQYKTDPGGARQEAIGAGDFDAADAFGKMDAEGRKVAAERAEILAGVGYGLRAMPYEQRKSALAHIGDDLVGRGFTPEQIANFDPTDENIDALVASVTPIKEMYERSKPVSVGKNNSLIDPSTGEVIFAAPDDPLEDEKTRAQIEYLRAGVNQRGASANAANARAAKSSAGASSGWEPF